MAAPKGSETFRFDVAFSFAGPHRDKVRAIAEIAAAMLGRDRVFYDKWHEDELNGDDGDVVLSTIYRSESLLVVADISDDYKDRKWCQTEARAIRALRQQLDSAGDRVQRLRLAYIRFDDGTVPGIPETTIDWDAREKSDQEIAELILSRLEKLQRGIAGQKKSKPKRENTTKITDTPTVISPLRPSGSPPLSLSPPPILFFHPATNDDRYSRREKELAWLDDCAKNTGIRIATVTGVGGLGKTSLVGH